MRISDWSSDVCSSDLDDLGSAERLADIADCDRRHCNSSLTGGPLPPSSLASAAAGPSAGQVTTAKRGVAYSQSSRIIKRSAKAPCPLAGRADTDIARLERVIAGSGGKRSEECRVGKECVRTGRSRGGPS